MSEVSYKVNISYEDGTEVSYAFKTEGDLEGLRYHLTELVRIDGYSYVEDVQFRLDNGTYKRGDLFR